MKLKYFTSLPYGSSLDIIHQMVLEGFPMLFKDNGNNEIDLFTTDPDLALKWIDQKCQEWVYVEFTSYYDPAKEESCPT